MKRQSVAPITLAFSGTQCSMKRSLGMNVANIMGWRFGKLAGSDNGSDGDNDVTKDSNGFITDEECKLDTANTSCRVIESWYVHNMFYSKVFSTKPCSIFKISLVFSWFVL